MNNARQHLFRCVRNFMTNGDFSTLQAAQRYYNLWHFQGEFKRVAAIEPEPERRASVYAVNLSFNLFAMQRIEQVTSCCSPSKLLALTEQEVVDWFFGFQAPISEPYQDQ
ncbi:hypothetical protein [Spirosoma sp.]|uniref:hypothetical protein n=1 Tax=Spirosoma sp. TaxID=1899569 RepID=UPI00262F57BB|nr:hypothetical protein [Spirosoma sp.]MCX6217593.1 hypothetical protein [Spirosoma sp.]